MTEGYYPSRNTGSRMFVKQVDDSSTENYVDYDNGQDFFSPTKVLHVQPHGFSSIPVQDAHMLVAHMGHRHDSPYAFGGEHPKHKPTKLGAGNTALYNASGQIIKMIGKDRNDTIPGDLTQGMQNGTITVKSLTIKCGDVTFKISSKGVDITGGYVKVNGHAIDDTHQHTNSGGVGLGGPPQ